MHMVCRAVTPAVAPSNLQLLEPVIRQRAGKILDELPIGEDFVETGLFH